MTDKLSPEARARLAEKLETNLRDKLRQRRPRPWIFAAIGLPIVGLLLWGLRLVSQAPSVPPPLMLIAFDAVFDQADAQLIAPGHPEVNLEGFEIQWRNPDGTVFKAKTNRDGRAGVTLPVADQKREIVVSYVAPLDAYRRDVAVEVHPRPTRSRTIRISDLVKTDWSTVMMPSDRPPTPISAEPDETILYIAGDADPLTIPVIRQWLRHHQSTTLPPGPFLRDIPAGLAPPQQPTPSKNTK